MKPPTATEANDKPCMGQLHQDEDLHVWVTDSSWTYGFGPTRHCEHCSLCGLTRTRLAKE
jgi:hypothetical protein